MSHNRAPVCSCERGGEAGSGEGWMDEGEVVCQVEDGLTSAPMKLLNETEGTDDARL